MKFHDLHKQELISVLGRAAQTPHLLDAFLEDLLTPREYEAIIRRWQIVKRLAKGVPQRDIAKALGVSITKITRGSRELRDKKGGFKQILDLLSKKKK